MMSIRISIAFRFLIFFIIILILVQCQNKIFPEIRAVQISQNFPYIMMNGDVHHYDTIDIKVYYYKNKILISPSYEHETLNNGELVKSELIWYFFVFKKDSKVGYLTDKRINIFNAKSSVDTFLSHRYAYSNNYTEIFNKSNPIFLFEKYEDKEEITYKLILIHK